MHLPLIPDRDHHTSAGLELVEEGLGYMIGRGGDDDGVEGGVFEPSLIAVADAHVDVFVAEFAEQFLGALAEGGYDFDCVNLFDDLGQDGGLVAGTGTDFEDDVVGVGMENFGHRGDDIGLGDGLVVSDGLGMIDIREVAVGCRDE